MTKQQLRALLAEHNLTDLKMTTIGSKFVTVTYHDYVGNHPAGKNTGDDLAEVAAAAIYLDEGIVRIGRKTNQYTRRITVKMTFEQCAEAFWFCQERQ